MSTFLKHTTTMQEGWTALRDLAGAYDTDKPLLAAQLLGASGKGLVAEADRLERMLADGPFKEGIDHAAQVAKLKEFLGFIDYAFTNPTIREGLRDGEYFDVLIPLMEDQFGFVTIVDQFRQDYEFEGQPIPMEGPVYNSLLLMAEIYAVLLGVLLTLGVYWDEGSGNFIGMLGNLINDHMLAYNWLNSLEFKFPVWQRLASIRERLVRKHAYDFLVKDTPNSFYHYKPAKNISQLVEGDVIAELQMLHGVFVKAVEQKGRLPEGLAINPANGNITIGDLGELKVGSFTGIVIEIQDSTGVGFAHPLFITIHDDVLPQYEVYPAISISNHYTNNVLAEPMSIEGVTIQATQIVEGQLPPGIRFDSKTGRFQVEWPSLLEAGTYDFQVRVWTGEKVDVVLPVSIQLDEALTPEAGIPYLLTAPKLGSTYAMSDVIAYAPDSLDGMICPTPGYNLPAGFELNEARQIILTDPSVIVEGSMSFSIALNYASGPPQIHLVDFFVYPDSAFIYTTATPKRIAEYVVDDEIWQHPDFETSSLAVTLVGGSVQAGFTLEADGLLKFDGDTTALVAGTFYIVIKIVQDDVEMGNYILVWSVLPDLGVTYTINPPVEASGLALDDILAYPVVHFSTLERIAMLTLPTALPPGISFATDSGNFYVSKPTALVAGSWTFSVRSDLADGIVAYHSVTIDVL